MPIAGYIIHISFKFLTEASMKMAAFWDITSSSVLEFDRSPDDGGSKHIRNIGRLLWDCTLQYKKGCQLQHSVIFQEKV
jgi:hypothetical protein